MRKPFFLHMQKQRRRSAAGFDQRLCFRYIDIVQSFCFLNPKFQAIAIFCGCTAWFVSDLVEIPEDSFSHIAAHFLQVVAYCCMKVVLIAAWQYRLLLHESSTESSPFCSTFIQQQPTIYL